MKRTMMGLLAVAALALAACEGASSGPPNLEPRTWGDVLKG